jgi:cytochrome c-type biogenesis protein
MLSALPLGFIAGALSTLSPCVLPLLPILLASAAQAHSLGPLALAGGMALSFAGVGGVLAGLGFAVGFNGEILRQAAGILMLLFGVVLVSSRLQSAFAAIVSPLGSGWLEKFTPDGLGGQAALGFLLGIVWTPCTGPTLGAAVGLAANAQTAPQAFLIMLFFGMGAAAPLLALAYGSRQVLQKRKQLLGRIGTGGKSILGGVLLAVGLLVLSGLDKKIEALLVELSPDWLIDLTTKF